MRAYRVLLHIFAALLLLDYGMFSTPAPSAPEMSTTVISDTSDSKTIVTTAESTIVENDSSESGSGSGDDRLNNSITVSPNTTQSLKHGQANESIVDYPIITKNSKDYSAKENESISEKIASTAQPKQDSTTKAKGAKIGVSDSGSGSLTGGIIILIFIIILIVCLLFILYFLRKKARSYSFDLTRDDIPANDYADTPFRGDQQGVSYEQTNKGKCK
ncbi:uncharacterized protein [Garra rufa]|uniref:uncharacterized protein n=1 Tax=Garra rufa TaxID=137080 RepID=UPI003CCEE6DB